MFRAYHIYFELLAVFVIGTHYLAGNHHFWFRISYPSAPEINSPIEKK